MESSILVTKDGKTPLDKITRFIYPKSIIVFFNQEIYKNERYQILINNWLLVHILFGFIYYVVDPNLTRMIVFHTIFEIIEYILGEYNTSQEGYVEIIDSVFDTLFSILGFYIAKLLINKQKKI